MAVRSRRVVSSSVAGGLGFVTLYTVPADRTLILKTITVTQAAGVARSLGFGIGATTNYVKRDLALPADGSALWEVELVVEDELGALLEGAPA